MRIYWINIFKQGNLGMMARPKGGDWLEDEMLKLQQLGVQVVISLLEAEEIRELGLQNEKALCEGIGILFYHLPVPDRGVPKSGKDFKLLLNGIEKELADGKNIVIHCRMGIGRTSMLAASLCIRKGYPKENVFAYLSQMRTLTVPDTETQEAYVMNFE